MKRIIILVAIAAVVTFAIWDLASGITRDELLWGVGIVIVIALGISSMMRKPTEKDRR